MSSTGIKIIFFFITLYFLIPLHEKLYGQDRNLHTESDSQTGLATQNINNESTSLAQQILIIDSPGKKGKEVEDTTLVVNSELPLYAALYNNGKYKNEAKVDWFWADTSKTRGAYRDSSVYLGTGSSLIFKPTTADTGFIYVKDLPSAPGDTTGIIKIIYSEKLNINPPYSANATITQGQSNILVTFLTQNSGNFPSIIQEANLQFIAADTHIINTQFTVHRIDTITIIRPGETKQFEFLVDAHSNADTGLVSVNVQLMTGEAFYTNIEPMHHWQVQTPPLLNIDLIDALVEEVFPGQEDIFVVMYVSNKGGASVNNMQASLTFWRNGQDVSAEYEFVMSENNPQFIKGDSSAQLNLIVQAKSNATYGTVVINGKISARDANTGIAFSDEGADLQASWLVTQTTSAQIGIISTKVICPNASVNGNGEVNIGQKYSVEVVVKNQGTEDIQSIGVTLSSDGMSKFMTSSSYVIPSLYQYQSDTVTYQFEAHAESIPGFEDFIARIDSARTAGGAKVTINAAFDSLAQVKIFYPANLILTLESSVVRNPVGQTFDVKTTVKHSPENAGFDSTGRISIKLPPSYQLISSHISQPFEDNESVTWKVRSPTIPGAADSILVYLSQIPHDKNDPSQFARVAVDSAYLVVETLDTFIKVADVAIIYPEGAKDDTISTNQQFLVRARMKSQLVENISARIVPPANFSIQDVVIKPLQADSVTWWLRAPISVSHFSEQIIVHAWGKIENDTTTVFSRPDSALSIVTVSSSNLKVSAEIINPPSALQGRISPGLLFQIKGEILNSGEADVYGAESLFIDVQDRTNFQVIGDTLLSVENQPAIWTIQASDKLDVTPKIIKVRILDIPYDENSDEETFIVLENQVADVQVYTTITSIPLMIRQLPEIAPKAIAPGITEIMMGLEFSNLNNEIGYPIQIDALKFDIEDKSQNLISTQSLISGFRIKCDDSIAGEAASILHNPIEISLTNPIILDAQQKKQAFVEIDFHESLTQPFQLNLRNTSYIKINSVFPVSIVDELKNPIEILNLRSHYPVIIENDFKKSFRNYPNPFGSPDRRTTHFIYHLPQDCDIELKIYTLIGELVWSCFYSSNTPQGKKGLHRENDIVWDARNSRGNQVLNGVYIARMKTSYGEAAITKIAVIK